MFRLRYIPCSVFTDIDLVTVTGDTMWKHFKNNSGCGRPTLLVAVGTTGIFDPSIRASRFMRWVTPAAHISCVPIGGRI